MGSVDVHSAKDNAKASMLEMLLFIQLTPRSFDLILPEATTHPLEFAA